MICFLKADELIKIGYVKDVDIFQLTDTLIALEFERLEKNAKTDLALDFNDEIVSIEEMGELETTDISVSGDNLFYCNGILTKNSFGLPATADLMIALISTEQLEKMNQLMVKQLKNRYYDCNTNKRFTVGIDRSKMRLYDVEDPHSNVMVDNSSQATSAKTTPFTAGGNRQKSNFAGFKT